MTILIALATAVIAILVFMGMIHAGSSVWIAGGLALLISNLVAAIIAVVADTWSDRQPDDDRVL